MYTKLPRCQTISNTAEPCCYSSKHLNACGRPADVHLPNSYNVTQDDWYQEIVAISHFLVALLVSKYFMTAAPAGT